MKSMFRLLVALLLVGGWSAAAMALHVIITPGAGGTLPVRIILLPKDHIAITDTYVDTRHWTLDDEIRPGAGDANEAPPQGSRL